ncbi:MAG: hypothetical protein Tsb002_13490 [Wenzhouxiangellaceae bacterium]
MAKKSNSELIHQTTQREANWLIKTLETMLRPLARMLVGRVSVHAVCDLLKQLYLQEAARKLEENGERMTRASLAMLSGWDTRTVTEALDRGINIEPTRIWPELGIITLWQTDPKYKNRRGGEPKELSLYGDGPNFFKLVVRAIGRNITPKAVMGKLLDRKLVSMTNEGNVQIASTRYREFMPKERAKIEEIAKGMGNLVDE